VSATVFLTENFMQMVIEIFADFAWICISVLHIRNVVKTDLTKFRSFKAQVNDYTENYELLMASRK
jgi:hypothetical protein